jgi:hypothetical protein
MKRKMHLLKKKTSKLGQIKDESKLGEEGQK